MSLIERILNEDLDGCEKTIVQDKELQRLEAELAEKLSKYGEAEYFELEDIVSSFNARIGRICYTQGIIDTCELLVDIKKSPLELLSKYKL